MEDRTDALAVDDSEMSDPARNAAIWYASDGYDPQAKGINGRRVAGASFLRGFLRHADVDEFVLLTHDVGALAPVRDLANELRPDKAVRAVPLLRPRGIAPLSSVYFPSPNYFAESWRRAPYGQASWSICGITHTTATAAVMQGMFDLRMSPVAEWDAVICTSRAVQASMQTQMGLIEEHMRRYLRANPPPAPMLPVIPLGIHCDDFTPDPAAGRALRERLGAAQGDVVFTTIARLTPHEKFDPLPVYLALQSAARHLKGGQRLHLVFCGLTRDDYDRKVFTEGAATLMPDVNFLLTDGADANERKAALSGADVFLFLIDNIQETFGLAPIEAMAAGLPLLVSDWDGMKDTVTPDVGFRVASRMLPSGHLLPETLRYHGGSDSYVQYGAANSAMTEIDMEELCARILELVGDPDLRARLGAAGRVRARSHYDWQVVIPQMQDLWAEQDRIRLASAGKALRYRADGLPVAPAPSLLFGSYPTELARFDATLVVATDLGDRPDLAATLAVRNYQGLRRIFAPPEQIAAVLERVRAAGTKGTSVSDLAIAQGLDGVSAERIVIWLLKYGFVRRAAG